MEICVSPDSPGDFRLQSSQHGIETNEVLSLECKRGKSRSMRMLSQLSLHRRVLIIVVMKLVLLDWVLKTKVSFFLSLRSVWK